jgi:hypothetical protein
LTPSPRSLPDRLVATGTTDAERVLDDSEHMHAGSRSPHVSRPVCRSIETSIL